MRLDAQPKNEVAYKKRSYLTYIITILEKLLQHKKHCENNNVN